MTWITVQVTPVGEGPTVDDPVEDLLLVARMAREATDRFSPMITWNPVAGAPVVAKINGYSGDIKADLDMAFTELREIAGPPSWFAVTLDSFARDGGPDEDGPRPGQLEEAFLTGDMSVVEQMVTIFMAPDTRELTMIRQVYRWIPSEGWEWSEPQVVESPDDAVCTAVRMFG